jgi:ribose transport system substrate-binding protein
VGCSSSAGPSSSPAGPSSSPAGPSSSPGGSSSASSAGTALDGARSVVAEYLKTPTQITQTVPLPDPVPKGKSIIYLNQGSVPAITEIGQGVQAAAQAVGWGYSEIDYDPSNPSTLQAAFTSALAKHPTVVAVTGEATSLYGASILSAYQHAGVPIIAGATAPVTSQQSLVGTPGSSKSNAVMGKILANWFVTDSGGDGSAVVVNLNSFPALAAFASTFGPTVASVCKACNLYNLNITLNQVASGQVPAAVVDALRSHPAAKYVIFDDGDWASGINSALNAAGLSSIKVAGATPTPEQFSALRSKTQQAWVGFPFTYVGYEIIDTALRQVEGAPLTSNDDYVPTQILTPANVGASNAFDEPSDALQQFLKLWKVSS